MMEVFVFFFFFSIFVVEIELEKSEGGLQVNRILVKGSKERGIRSIRIFVTRRRKYSNASNVAN